MSRRQEGCSCHTPLPTGEALKLLEEHHQFPGPYTFKVIGYADEDFEREVRQTASGVLSPEAECQVSARLSSGGRYVSLSVEACMKDSAQVLAMYAALKKIEGVVMLV